MSRSLVKVAERVAVYEEESKVLSVVVETISSVASRGGRLAETEYLSVHVNSLAADV